MNNNVNMNNANPNTEVKVSKVKRLPTMAEKKIIAIKANVLTISKKDSRINNKHQKIINYILKKMKTIVSDTVDITLKELVPHVFNLDVSRISRYLNKLCEWGYFKKKQVKDSNGYRWKHLQVSVGNIAMDAASAATKNKPTKARKNLLRKTQTSNNNNPTKVGFIITKINHHNNLPTKKIKKTEEGKLKSVFSFSNTSQNAKNDTIKQMLILLVKKLRKRVPFNDDMARKMNAAFQQKFKTMDMWERYLNDKIVGKIYSIPGFIRYLLNFETINEWLNWDSVKRIGTKMESGIEVPPKIDEQNAQEILQSIYVQNFGKSEISRYPKLALSQSDLQNLVLSCISIQEELDVMHKEEDRLKEKINSGEDRSGWYREYLERNLSYRISSNRDLLYRKLSKFLDSEREGVS